jgi:hypothetical protein
MSHFYIIKHINKFLVNEVYMFVGIAKLYEYLTLNAVPTFKFISKSSICDLDNFR